VAPTTVEADKPGPRAADPTKERIESSTKHVIAEASVTVATPSPVRPSEALLGAKGSIEGPTRHLVASQSAAASAASDFVNPKVQPGLVHWHPSFAAACQKALHSRKPVLLFQMMGQLDEQFC
jgi:hypothetical protein